jgi:hypothetical protein
MLLVFQVALTFAKGARPQKGKNLAIAEWPTKSGPADYVLFAGLQPVGVVEAKRKNKDVSGSLEQASYGDGSDIGVHLLMAVLGPVVAYTIVKAAPAALERAFGGGDGGQAGAGLAGAMQAKVLGVAQAAGMALGGIGGGGAGAGGGEAAGAAAGGGGEGAGGAGAGTGGGGGGGGAQASAGGQTSGPAARGAA